MYISSNAAQRDEINTSIKEDATMKKIGLGIAIILFGILLELSMDWNLAYFDWAIGTIGLSFAVAGFLSKEDR